MPEFGKSRKLDKSVKSVHDMLYLVESVVLRVITLGTFIYGAYQFVRMLVLR